MYAIGLTIVGLLTAILSSQILMFILRDRPLTYHPPRTSFDGLETVEDYLSDMLQLLERQTEYLLDLVNEAQREK